MAGTIKVTTGKLSAAAQQMRSINQQLSLDLDTIKNQITSLNGSWESDSSRSVRAKILEKETLFARYKQTIDEYANKLDEIAANYVQTESALTGNADRLK